VTGIIIYGNKVYAGYEFFILPPKVRKLTHEKNDIKRSADYDATLQTRRFKGV
jgi:hypothetical protein